MQQQQQLASLVALCMRSASLMTPATSKILNENHACARKYKCRSEKNTKLSSRAKDIIKIHKWLRKAPGEYLQLKLFFPICHFNEGWLLNSALDTHIYSIWHFCTTAFIWAQWWTHNLQPSPQLCKLYKTDRPVKLAMIIYLLALIHERGFERAQLPPYSPDVGSSNFNLIPNIKKL